MRVLVNAGIEVHVALPDGGTLADKCRNAGIHVHLIDLDIPLKHPWFLHTVFRQLRELVDRLDPHIIHSHFVSTTLVMRLGLGNRYKIPRIFQVPGPLHLEHTFFRRIELATAGRQDYWIGSCEWTCKRYLAAGVSQHQVSLSYYGKDLANFVPPEKGELRQKFHLDNRTRLVGMVAYMYPPKRYLGQSRGIKGHEDLIDAIAISRHTDPDIVGVFVGGAWNNATWYEKRIIEYGRQKLGDHVLFLGTRNDVTRMYVDFDVAVHPSLSENVGGAAESLLLGIPTIATNIGGLPDLVIPQKTGWLVEAKDPVMLAQTILEVLAHPDQAKKLALQGQELAKKLFDIERTANDIMQIYRAILKT